MWSTIGYTYGLILDPISECQVCLTLYECAQKVALNVQWPTTPTKCVGLPIKLAHDVTYRTALLKLNQKEG